MPELLELLLDPELVGVAALLLAAVHRTGVKAGIAPESREERTRDEERERRWR